LSYTVLKLVRFFRHSVEVIGVVRRESSHSVYLFVSVIKGGSFLVLSWWEREGWNWKVSCCIIDHCLKVVQSIFCGSFVSFCVSLILLRPDMLYFLCCFLTKLC